MNTLPTSIGEYTCIRDVIGSGAFALVLKGHHSKNPEMQVAIKAIAKKNLCRRNLTLLDKEKKILEELSALKHSNLVSLLHCEETSTHVFLIMEYCNAGDLADYLQLKKRLSEEVIRMFLRQIADALKVIHSCGVVHRDLKPQNILMSIPNDAQLLSADQYTLKIADFGFARFLQSGVMPGTLCGSPMYMAPEVLMSLQYDAKADLWSVGTILYQCLVGCAPFQAKSPTILRNYYERHNELEPRLPQSASVEFSDLTRRLLCKDPKRRLSLDGMLQHQFLCKRTNHNATNERFIKRTPMLPIDCSETLKNAAAIRDFEIIEKEQCNLSVNPKHLLTRKSQTQFHPIQCDVEQLKQHNLELVVNQSNNNGKRFGLQEQPTSLYEVSLSNKSCLPERDPSSVASSSPTSEPFIAQSKSFEIERLFDDNDSRSFESSEFHLSSHQNIPDTDADSNKTFERVEFISELIGYIFGLMSRLSNPFGCRNADPITVEDVKCSLALRCTDFISDTINLVKSQTESNALKVTPALVNKLRLFCKQHNHCLRLIETTFHARVKPVHSTRGKESSTRTSQSLELPNSNRILLKHALETCMNAVTDEYFGNNPAKCMAEYKECHVIFHVLNQQCPNQEAELFAKLRDQVEKRMLKLQQRQRE